MLDPRIVRLPGIRPAISISAAFSLIQAFLVVGQAVGLSFAIVGVWEGNALSLQIPWIALFFSCFVFRQMAVSASSFVADKFAQNTAAGVRKQLLESTFDMGPAGVREFGSAAVTANLLEGTDAVQDYLSIIIPKTTNVILIPLVLLITMFLFDWVSGLIALICYPFIMLFMKLIGMSAKAEASRKYREFENMSNNFTDTASCIGTLKAFGVSRSFSGRIFNASERFRELTMKTLSIAMLSSTVLDVFATLALAAVAIMLGFRLVDGSMTFLPALAILMMVPEYFRPIREFGDDYHATLDGRTALDSIMRICNAAIEKNDFLDRIDLYVNSNSKIGIFGPSGAGKSTLMDALSGFSENNKVSLQIDDNTVNLRSAEWKDRVAYIPQSPYIFNGSMRDNLAFYNTSATDSDIYDALETVGLKEFATSLPQKLDTLIGADKLQLSGGQLQRIALARALLDKKRNVWILDEPTAHLDIETEYDLKEQILPLMKGRIVFFGTHRMHWLDDMDDAIFLNDGHLCKPQYERIAS